MGYNRNKAFLPILTEFDPANLQSHEFRLIGGIVGL